MFSVTTTRFIASLAMTLLLWLTCSTGAVAADPVNPDPCTDLWDCIYPPILGGTTAGSAMICQNKTGTWSISDLVTPGYKERCGKKKHPGIRSASGTGNIDWKWKVEGAKNFSEEGVGKTFDKSYSEPGDYKITWVGSALTDDKGEVNECEKPADVTVNDTFKVILEERLFSVQPKSPSDFDKAFCLGEKRTGTFTIKDYSQCFQGPYVVKWHIEKSGDPTVTVTPTEGEITIESDLQEISVPVDVSVANPTVAGQVKLTFIGVNEYQTQSTEVTVTVKKPDYVAKFDIGDQKICRSKTLDVPFTITNRGCPVDEVVTWSVELKAGGSLPLTLANNRGVTLVAPGTPFKGIIQVSCDEAPLSGAVTLKLKATAPSNSNGVTDSFDISLSQPSISGDVESGMACIGEQLVVSAFVKNDSDCDELIKWRVQKIGGFLQVELAENTGVEVLPAHTPLIKMVTVNIDPLSPNGKAELQLTVEVANQVVFTSGNASNGIIHDTASPNEGVAIGPGAPLATLVPSESDHSDPVKFTIGHSIITNDTPRKRELKGKLRLTYKSGDRDSINLFKANGQPYTLGTPIEVLEVGHEGCGRHDWHLGNVGMGFIGKKIGEVVLTASVTPDLDDGGQGRATITSDITFRVIKPDIVPTVPKFAECLKKRSGKADEPVIIMTSGGDKATNGCSLVGREKGSKNRWNFTAKYDYPVFDGDTGTYAVVWDVAGGQIASGSAGSGQSGGSESVAVKYHAGQFKPTLKVYRTFNGQTILVGTAAIHTLNVYSADVDGTAWAVTSVADDDKYGSETKLERRADESVSMNVQVGVDGKAQGTSRVRVSPDGYPQNEYWVTAGDSGDLPQPYAFKPESTAKAWVQGYGDPSSSIDNLSVRIKGSKSYGDDATPAKFTTVLVEAGVDASRDQRITFDGIDRTSMVNPYRFWLNNNRDAVISGQDSVLSFGGYTEEDEAETGPIDSAGDHITCQRDLEDFTRYWVAISNRRVIGSRLRKGDVQVQFRIRPLSQSPQVKLFLAAGPDGSVAYLTDYVGVGKAQAPDTDNPKANVRYHSAVTPTVGTSFVQMSLPGIADSSLAEALVSDDHAPDGTRTLAPFLFEGVAAGVGDLEVRITVTLDGVQVPLGHGRATVDLRDIKQFYEQWTLGDTPLTFASPTPTHVASTLTYNDNDKYFSDQKYLLYVHGWNMSTADKDVYANTAYKRLWWNGYKGRFGALRWPTNNGFTSWYSPATDPQHYDNSEFIAWQTGERLANWLPGQSSRNHCPIDLLAHSMGNVVVGNALRVIPTGQEAVVGVYVASQAAVPARLYDSSMTRCRTWNPSLLGYSSWNTPDVYQTGLLQTVAQRFNVANFHNRNDYALSERVSGVNQLFKPDNNQGDYLVGATDVNTVTETNFRDRFHNVSRSGFPKAVTYSYVVFRWSGSDPTPQADYPTYYHLTGIEQPPMAQYRIMAYLSESRHFPLGSSFSLLFQPGAAGGDVDLNRSTIWPTPSGKHLEDDENAFGPYSSHRWHSGQFRMTMPEQKEYWKSLMGTCGYATDGVLP